VSGTTTSDSEGRFSVSGLAAGTYWVETTEPGFARNTRLGVQVMAGRAQDLSITLNVDSISQSITVQESVSAAVDLAPQGNTLDATSAQTEISNTVITNFMAPVSDFAEVIQQAPNAFSLNPNGIGLGQGKSFFRGFADGQYTLIFDGIPFEDTNSPTHHSWASFPRKWISSTDFDRSPGQASNFGPTNFGGSINMKSPELKADPNIRATFSYGSFNTQLYSLDFDSGLLGKGRKDAVLANVNAMTSDGYQTFNYQQRDAGYGKFQHRFSDRSSLTLYGGVVDIWNNTPNTTNPTRASRSSETTSFSMTHHCYRTAHRTLITTAITLTTCRRISSMRALSTTWVPDGWSTSNCTRPATGTSSFTRKLLVPEWRHGQLEYIEAERRRQTERLPPCRRYIGREQDNEMGHLPNRHVVRLGIYGSISDSVEHPHSGRHSAR
jgi:iron complex outermembrane receptor protein